MCFNCKAANYRSLFYLILYVGSLNGERMWICLHRYLCDDVAGIGCSGFGARSGGSAMASV